MKSNSNHTRTHPNDVEELRALLKQEKETLVSMFLANVPSEELTEQFRRIDELSRKVRMLGE